MDLLRLLQLSDYFLAFISPGLSHFLFLFLCWIRSWNLRLLADNTVSVDHDAHIWKVRFPFWLGKWHQSALSESHTVRSRSIANFGDIFFCFAGLNSHTRSPVLYLSCFYSSVIKLILPTNISSNILPVIIMDYFQFMTHFRYPLMVTGRRHSRRRSNHHLYRYFIRLWVVSCCPRLL